MICESLLINSVGVVLLLFLLLSWHLNNNFNYWKKKGVPFVKPLPYFGNFKDLFLFKRPFDIIFYDIYKELEGHSFAGIFHSRIPGIMIRDQELAKDILVRDFNILPDRGLKVGGPEDPLSQNLFNLEGNKWKWLRAKLSPVFTSGKIKGMYILIAECAKNLQSEVDRLVDSGPADTDTRDLVARFTTDVIGSTAFGINCNSLANPDSEFRRMSKRIFGGSLMNLLRQFVVFFMPKISKSLNIKDTDPEVEEFFLGMVRDTVQHRIANNVTRNDFLQLLIELKKKGSEDATEYTKKENSANEVTEEKFELDDDLMAAQCFVFFFAGFETSSSTISFCLYELALQPDLQQRVWEEVNEILGDSECPTYEQVAQLKLLDQCVSETLRKYPPAGTLLRIVRDSYTIRGTDVTLEKGTRLFIPAYCFHRDPKYFPDPEKFDPERFSEEAKASRPSCSYLPFGDGPRFCIGNRFGLLQTKVGLCALLSRYAFDVCSRTMIPLVYDPLAPLLAPKGGMWLKVSKREKQTK